MMTGQARKISQCVLLHKDIQLVALNNSFKAIQIFK